MKQQRMNKQRGAVLIIVALCLPILIGFLGLVVDLGHLFVTKTELQSSLDACALAAAQELNGASDALTRARNAGKTVGNINKADFQATSVSIDDVDITFSETLSPFSGVAAAADAKFVQCAKAKTGISSWFMQVLGIFQSDVSAIAVAALTPSQGSCVLPVGFCTNNVTPPAVCPDGTAPDKYGLCIGDWRNGKLDKSITGAFNWLSLPTMPNGAPGVTTALAGYGACSVTKGPVNAQTGNLGNDAAKAWNSRFGLYQGGGNNPSIDTAPPDFSGYTYSDTNKGKTSFPQQRNAYPDFLDQQRSINSSYQGNNASGMSLPGGYSSTSSTDHAAKGANRRLVVIPMLDCTQWVNGPGGKTNIIQDFACVLLLHPIDTFDKVIMEYRGLANDPNSPCSSYGIPGGTGSGALVSALVR